jgi:hypothetical protein
LFPLSQWRRPSILIFTAVALDRVAFVASVNRTDKRKAAQEGREVTQADEVAYESASGVEEEAC